jgi:hypothetical protein
VTIESDDSPVSRGNVGSIGSVRLQILPQVSARTFPMKRLDEINMIQRQSQKIPWRDRAADKPPTPIPLPIS